MMKEFMFGTRKFAEGVEVSNDMRATNSNNNDLIIGGSRSGKTGGYIYNMLLNPTESYVVSDTKGQLHKMFGAYLESKGYEVEVLNLVNPEDSIGYNPFDYVKRHSDGSVYEKDIKSLANLITPNLDSKDPYWEKAACRYVVMLMAYVASALPRREQNIYSVVKMHRACQTNAGMDIIKEWVEENPDSFAAAKYNEVIPLKTAEKTWACVVDFASEILEPFGYSEYKSIFANTKNIDLRSLGRKKKVLFVNVSDNDTTFHCISNLLNVQIFQTLIEDADSHYDGRLDVPVRIILDDFAASPTIDGFDNLISIIASREISVSIIIQSISQLNSKYDVDCAKTIINNCDHLLYLSGHDDTTADYIGGYINKNRNTILNLPKDKQILVSDGHEAMIVPKLVPYKDSEKLIDFAREYAKKADSMAKANALANKSSGGSHDKDKTVEDFQEVREERESLDRIIARANSSRELEAELRRKKAQEEFDAFMFQNTAMDDSFYEDFDDDIEDDDFGDDDWLEEDEYYCENEYGIIIKRSVGEAKANPSASEAEENPLASEYEETIEVGETPEVEANSFISDHKAACCKGSEDNKKNRKGE